MGEQFVFVVMGQTGEYSDHKYWPVGAFISEAEANVRLVWCEEEAKRLGVWSGNDAHVSRDWGSKYESAADPDMSVDYTGTDYYVMKLPLLEKGRP